MDFAWKKRGWKHKHKEEVYIWSSTLCMSKYVWLWEWKPRGNIKMSQLAEFKPSQKLFLVLIKEMAPGYIYARVSLLLCVDL